MASVLVDGLRLPVAVSGHAALELCNTRAGWRSATPKEYLQSYPHLAVWAREAGLIGRRTCADALAAAAERPAEADRVRRRALAFRGALYGALTGGETASTWDEINAEVSAALSAARLRRHGGAVRDLRADARPGWAAWPQAGQRGEESGAGAGPARNGLVSGGGEPAVPADWELGGDLLAAPLLATAWAAAGLLTSAAAGDVRACPGDGCGWLFRDPRGRRRWCSMAWCGNRAKVRRHAQRSRLLATGPDPAPALRPAR